MDEADLFCPRRRKARRRRIAEPGRTCRELLLGDAMKASDDAAELRGRRGDDEEDEFEGLSEFEEDEEFDDDDLDEDEDEEGPDEDEDEAYDDLDEDFDDDGEPRRGGPGRPRRDWSE